MEHSYLTDKFQEYLRSIDVSSFSSARLEAIEAAKSVLGELEIDNLRYILLGSGHSRTAWWDTKRELVVKTHAFSMPATEENNLEYSAWKFLMNGKGSKYVAPISHIALEGQVLYMAPCLPLGRTDVVLEIPGFLCYYRRNNYGWLQVSNTIERLVSLDYANVEFETGIEPWCPILRQKRDDADNECGFYMPSQKFYAVGDCRLIESKERCDEEGNLLPDHPKDKYARFIANNESTIFHLEKLAEEKGISNRYLKKYRDTVKEVAEQKEREEQAVIKKMLIKG